MSSDRGAPKNRKTQQGKGSGPCRHTTPTVFLSEEEKLRMRFCLRRFALANAPFEEDVSMWKCDDLHRYLYECFSFHSMSIIAREALANDRLAFVYGLIIQCQELWV